MGNVPSPTVLAWTSTLSDMELEDLASRIDPERTVLFLGAGASVPSGGPTAVGLAERLSQVVTGGPRPSDDFNEVCSILEHRFGRSALVGALREELQSLQPSGGMLGLPTVDWSAIYTTNYDQLVEAGYAKANKSVVVVRSNFDFGRTATVAGTPLFKLHGCVTQDAIDGFKFSMLLTETDMRDFADYRETLFRQLALDMTAKDVLVVGNSLADPHLKREVDEVLRLHRDSGTPGELFILSYDPDADRAALLENRGASVAFGDLDDLLFALAASGTAVADTPHHQVNSEPDDLNARLTPTVVSVAHAAALKEDASAVFNGRAPRYSDIKAGFTFERSSEAVAADRLRNGNDKILTIVGAGGVGKTSLARRLGLRFHSEGWPVWEHRTQFPFQAKEWIAVERQLSAGGRQGMLVLDDCTEYLGQVNQLANHIAEQEDPALRLVVTATYGQWKPRLKSPAFFSCGTTVELSQLVESEIEGLLNLVASVDSIKHLVDSSFRARSRTEQRSDLRRKCSADMYVCLKNVFATDALDTILLQEYAALSGNIQQIYRHVAALEASGIQVHRQLVVRMLGISGGTVLSLLDLMEGVVDEFDIAPSSGLYGWSTRHKVVAETLTRYKFADQQERFELLGRVIRGLNPVAHIELRAVTNLCDRDFGVGSLTDPDQRIDLYRQLISIAPGERVPWHRLISDLLRSGLLEQAEQEIRDSISAVGIDSPINRFRVRLATRRAETIPGILDEDRRAMLLRAQDFAIEGIRKWPHDKWAFRGYVDVGLSMAELDGTTEILDDGIERMRNAASRILDPDLTEWLQSAETSRRGFAP